MTDAIISTYVKALLDAGAEVYEVGGPVRNRLLGLPAKDHDLLCRRLPMPRILSILKPFGKIAAVGKSFGIIKFTPHRAAGLAIDIALPRRERSTGSGHRDFDVDFDPELPVEEDLRRRDFTINAMAQSLTDGTLLDPFGGRADLEAKILRQVFPRAFEEDPLRLLRAVQFAARFGLTIEPVTLCAMRENASRIETVSGERVGQELVKLMSAAKPSRGFDLMDEAGLLPLVIPELAALKGIEQDKQPGDDVYGHTMRALDAARSDPAIENAGDLHLCIAILLHDIGKAKTARYHAPSKRTVFFGHQIVSAKLARRWMERVKLSAAGVDHDRVLALIENHMFETKATFTDRAIRRFVAKVGVDLIFMLLDLRLADNRGGKHPAGIKGVQRLSRRIREELAKKPPFGPKDLAIDGSDLMAMGIAEGPLVGAVLAQLVETVLDEPERNTRDVLLALAKKLINNPDVRAKADAARHGRRGRRSHDQDEPQEGGETRGQGG